MSTESRKTVDELLCIIADTKNPDDAVHRTSIVAITFNPFPCWRSKCPSKAVIICVN